MNKKKLYVGLIGIITLLGGLFYMNDGINNGSIVLTDELLVSLGLIVLSLFFFRFVIKKKQ